MRHLAALLYCWAPRFRCRRCLSFSVKGAGQWKWSLAIEQEPSSWPACALCVYVCVSVCACLCASPQSPSLLLRGCGVAGVRSDLGCPDGARTLLERCEWCSSGEGQESEHRVESMLRVGLCRAGKTRTVGEECSFWEGAG